MLPGDVRQVADKHKETTLERAVLFALWLIMVETEGGTTAYNVFPLQLYYQFLYPHLAYLESLRRGTKIQRL